MEFDWGGLGGNVQPGAAGDDWQAAARQPASPQPFPYPDAPGTLDVRQVTVADAIRSLDSLGIDDAWQLSATLRAAPATLRIGDLLDPLRLLSVNRAFRNLVIGRIAEDLFREHCLAPLAAAGFEIQDHRAAHDNRDFSIVRAGHELPINVKVAGTRFEQAREYVGLEPDDCIPINAYKAVGAADPNQGRAPDLIYVHLVEHGLRQKVDDQVTELDQDLAVVWQLLSWYGGRGQKAAQDRFIDALFERHGEELMALSQGPGNFRVISAKKVLSIMDNKRSRVTQLGAKNGFGGEPNVHVSRSEETIAWQALASLLRNRGITAVLRGINRTEERERADPSL